MIMIIIIIIMFNIIIIIMLYKLMFVYDIESTIVLLFEGDFLMFLEKFK